jgi:hypothetical protein
MAVHSGMSKATVQKIWSSRGIKPHLVRTFKLSNDPRFEEKLVDVVGLYLDPPQRAVVLCVDELCEASHNSSDAVILTGRGRMAC